MWTREGEIMSLYPAHSIDKRLTIHDFRLSKSSNPWPVLTAYDAWSARIFDDAGIPMLLVGDSAAMVMYGHETTLGITLDEMIPMVKSVVNATKRAFVVADLPFGTYQASPEKAVQSSLDLIKATGAHAVKLEGGTHMQNQIRQLVEAGVPVVGHVGMTPQSVNAFGGFKLQGKGEAAHAVLEDARSVQEAGAFAVVLEVVPKELGKIVTEKLSIPVIGIGAGNQTDAQVLVWQDLFGASSSSKPAKFVKPYLDLYSLMRNGAMQWADDVASRSYPDENHSYQDSK